MCSEIAQVATWTNAHLSLYLRCTPPPKQTTPGGEAPNKHSLSSMWRVTWASFLILANTRFRVRLIIKWRLCRIVVVAIKVDETAEGVVTLADYSSANNLGKDTSLLVLILCVTASWMSLPGSSTYLQRSTALIVQPAAPQFYRPAGPVWEAMRSHTYLPPNIKRHFGPKMLFDLSFVLLEFVTSLLVTEKVPKHVV